MPCHTLYCFIFRQLHWTRVSSLTLWQGLETAVLGVALIKQPKLHCGFTPPLISFSDWMHAAK